MVDFTQQDQHIYTSFSFKDLDLPVADLGIQDILGDKFTKLIGYTPELNR
jgi:hypothetical protein